MIDAEVAQLATQVARVLVLQIAPEQHLSFNALAEGYFKDPEKALKGAVRRREDKLGFETSEVVTFLIPIIIDIVIETIFYLVDEAKKSQKVPSTAATSHVVRNWFKLSTKEKKEDQNDEGLPELSPQHLAYIRVIIIKKARHFGWSKKKGEQLADAVIALLVTTKKLK